ncbi:MAG TPA: YkvA family protein [Dongiaceae bacterium]|nr:YkvA family protein [Dongiaceae bacterium]
MASGEGGVSDDTAPAGGREPSGTGREVVLYDPAKLQRDQAAVEDGFWKKLRRVASKLPFLDELLAAYYCAIDPATPLQVKAILFGALAYFIMPVDLIPDFIAWFGFTDDAAVLFAAIRTVSGNIKPGHREQAKASLARLAAD